MQHTVEKRAEREKIESGEWSMECGEQSVERRAVRRKRKVEWTVE